MNLGTKNSLMAMLAMVTMQSESVYRIEVSYHETGKEPGTGGAKLVLSQEGTIENLFDMVVGVVKEKHKEPSFCACTGYAYLLEDYAKYTETQEDPEPMNRYGKPTAFLSYTLWGFLFATDNPMEEVILRYDKFPSNLTPDEIALIEGVIDPETDTIGDIDDTAGMLQTEEENALRAEDTRGEGLG